MNYPKFLENNNKIGVTALSAGVGRKLDSFSLSIENLNKAGYEVVETPSVRVNNIRSNSAKMRAFELMQLVDDMSIGFIINASGGDYALEALKYIDFDKIAKAEKWIMGYSDPTSILYCLTTNYDLSTIYGYNAGSFDHFDLHYTLKDAINMLSGNLKKQYSSNFHEAVNFDIQGEYILDIPTEIISNVGDCELQGRIIGGCFEVIDNVLGTEYDGFKKFQEKYSQDEIIWYFDIYDTPPDKLYLKLLQMNYMGYFDNVSGLLVGRVLFESDGIMDYMEAFETALQGKKIIMQLDIGHTNPKTYIVNGAIAKFKLKNNISSIEFELS